MFIANLVIAALLTVCDFFISWDAWGSGDVFDETMSQALKINVWLVEYFQSCFCQNSKSISHQEDRSNLVRGLCQKYSSL